MVVEEWQKLLLQTVAQHIAMAINVAQQVAQRRMLALLEERSVIARELHDSLAQSLSYLKIQVSRLEKKITEASPKAEVLAVSKGLRSGLNGAYRQLRELLTTFRLRINEPDLGAALEATVDEYAQRGDIPIECENRLMNCRPGPNAEIHVIQIVREALSNVIRHANASRARVALDCDSAGIVRILVEDNGTGMQEQIDMLHHYGLPIMRERATWLGGDLQVTESPGGGTRVELTFSLRDYDQNEIQQGVLRS
jgi:two-component system nitrate/nitrite sensor histidine kinase NarX